MPTKLATPSEAETTTPDVARFKALLRTGGPGPYAYVVLLGLETFDLAKLLKSVERGFSYKTFERFTRNVAMPIDAILELLDLPRRTLTRRKRDGRFSPDESDRLLRASRLFAKTLGLFEGDMGAATEWLTSPQRGIGGAVPMNFAKTELGTREIETLIERLERGVFA